jgi:hypothetical protein
MGSDYLRRAQIAENGRLAMERQARLRGVLAMPLDEI